MDRGLAYLTRVLRSLHAAPAEREAAAMIAAQLSRPGDPVRTMARVGALLTPYFDRETPRALREIEMEDWADALADFPDWAIERAAKWWKSADNPQRRKRPLEGDIAERCRIEMRAVRATRVRARSGWAGTEAPEDRERCSPEAAARAMRAAGFSPAEAFTGPKRFGGAETGQSATDEQRGAA
ncbi:hypothetical protein [Rhodovulum sp. MB263]|uniref:hypothetical protein n=1 Tax=Rhodovulum sp. (strain MB263) TaxID=308754 RepID=UPI0009B758F7|nr:hypothetical protein [Rhodovulum sp. MB263]ARC89988.1 hypothetical protein B5V46_15935 [Rhodovulum sp. MB263]